MDGEVKDSALMLADEVVISKIYFIRGQKVMLDADLAELYQVETKVLKQAIRRNLELFPIHFMFELTEQEPKKREVVERAIYRWFLLNMVFCRFQIL
jgi:hypothetical protein